MIEIESASFNVKKILIGKDNGKFFSWCERTGILMGTFNTLEEAKKEVSPCNHFICRMANS